MDNKFALTISGLALSSRILEIEGAIAGPAHVARHYFQEIVLCDGTRAILRPILPEDKNALVDFHSRLSEETRFLRYHYLKGQLTENDLKDLCELDYTNAMALVAEVDRGGCRKSSGLAVISAYLLYTLLRSLLWFRTANSTKV